MDTKTLYLSKNNINVIPAQNAKRDSLPFYLGLKFQEVNEDNEPTDSFVKVAIQISSRCLMVFNSYLRSLQQGEFKQGLFNYTFINNSKNKSHTLTQFPVTVNRVHFCFETGSIKNSETISLETFEDSFEKHDIVIEDID